ncbi:related to Mannan endo-1,6-alpha-mannosidase DFG5 [Saccharomycodes ludwigii]|uniref:Mannan endo-1,6-alpha-mannosidase n=2 Tax=Saccharomycodes ludwigii TaxID=36035 RepID=A0A376B5Z6_9ASCO|nr:related to Mannan endo-1,6-alpha-mannosidase DFG5 [Saccharomycodes ludwigii]
MLNYYLGIRSGGTIGMFQPPYYWWEAGEAFGGMIENAYLCENYTFKTLIEQAIVYQSGDKYDFMTQNESKVEGNDDQGIWAITLMTAVERNFTTPSNFTHSLSQPVPSYENFTAVPDFLTMAENVYNLMGSRWDNSTCNGGLSWQIFNWNNGRDYKNTVSTGCLFNLAARLGRYTGNATYLEEAEYIWDWLETTGFIQLNESVPAVYDGASTESNCTDITKLQWSYNMGIVLGGAAYMYNATNGSRIGEVWKTRIEYLLEGAVTIFFKNNIMYESACQPYKTCNNDQRSFKSLFSRMLGYTSILAPFTAQTINKLIQKSAIAAAASCNGGYDKHTCGLNWFNGTNDGYYGLGEQMSALDVIQMLLIDTRPGPLTADGYTVDIEDGLEYLNSSGANANHVTYLGLILSTFISVFIIFFS